MTRAPGQGRHPLPVAEAFAESASRAGIGAGVLVVAYDQGMTGGAARLWWLLRHFGHDDVAVLDGGIGAGPGRSAWAEERSSRPVSGLGRAAATRSTRPSSLARLGEPSLAVVDARAPERFRGEVEPLDPVAGHIPGAVNVPPTQPLPEHVLAADEIAVYCGSGVVACADVLRLARAGRPDARLYPGSWSEWSRRVGSRSTPG